MLLGCAMFTAAAANPARVPILVEDAASPWSSLDGRGYANDLVRAASAAAGDDVQGTPMASFIGFSTIHPDSEAQRHNFNAGYQRISENGTRSSLQARWKLRCAKCRPE